MLEALRERRTPGLTQLERGPNRPTVYGPGPARAELRAVVPRLFTARGIGFVGTRIADNGLTKRS